MNSRRTIILFVAIAMAGLAAMGLLIYIRGIEDNVYAGRELVTVWVAEGAIPQGASGSDLQQRGLIVEKPIPAEFAPDAAIAVPGEEIVGLVAVNAIPAEQTIVKGMFAAPQVVATGVTDRLNERATDEENERRRDMTTFTFSAGGATAVAGLLEPGDYVNIMTRYSSPVDQLEDPEGDVVGGEESDEPPAKLGRDQPGQKDSAQPWKLGRGKIQKRKSSDPFHRLRHAPNRIKKGVRQSERSRSLG